MTNFNFNGQNGVATSANVNVVVKDTRPNGGNFKWQVNAVKRIKAWFDIYDLDMSGVNVEIIVNASEIAVKAEHNGVKYLIDTPITAKTSVSKIDNIVGDSFCSLVSAVSMAVLEQEQEYEQEYDTLGTGAIEMFNAYMRERVSEEFESLVSALEDSADEFMGEEVFCVFNYEFDYEQEWLDYITNMDDINVTFEYALDFYKEYIEWFINADDMQEYIYSIEEGCGAETEDHGCEECLVWVKNPYYVSDEMRANRIAKIVNDNWAKNAVEESVKLDWSLFNEQDMELMFSDNDFAKMVYDRVCESNKYFSECLAYDDCFYVWLTENVSCILVDYIYDLDSRPAWVNRNNFDFKDGGDYLEIIMFGSHKIGLYYDPSDSNADFAKAEIGAYGKRDMEYAVEIMDNRDMILALAKKARIVKPSVEEIIENALESAMDSGEEYYDDNICQIGKWYVNYTSPCDEFPDGCVLVVDERGCMYGNWCDVSDSGFAVEYLVNTIEKCNKEFNNVA